MFTVIPKLLTFIQGSDIISAMQGVYRETVSGWFLLFPAVRRRKEVLPMELLIAMAIILLFATGYIVAIKKD